MPTDAPIAAASRRNREPQGDVGKMFCAPTPAHTGQMRQNACLRVQEGTAAPGAHAGHRGPKSLCSALPKRLDRGRSALAAHTHPQRVSRLTHGMLEPNHMRRRLKNTPPVSCRTPSPPRRWPGSRRPSAARRARTPGWWRRNPRRPPCRPPAAASGADVTPREP